MLKFLVTTNQIKFCTSIQMMACQIYTQTLKRQTHARTSRTCTLSDAFSGCILDVHFYDIWKFNGGNQIWMWKHFLLKDWFAESRKFSIYFARLINKMALICLVLFSWFWNVGGPMRLHLKTRWALDSGPWLFDWKARRKSKQLEKQPHCQRERS